MSTHRATHPCPECGAGVAPTARFCGACGAALPEERGDLDHARARLHDLALRLEAAGDLVPEPLRTALSEVSAVEVDAVPRVVVLGEQGRGTRALANRLVGAARLKAGPSAGDAAAVLAHDPHATGLLRRATVEVAPPLAAGAEEMASGVIPALVRADVVLVALSAAQLLSATERRILSSLWPLVSAPAALVVGRMDALEDDDDYADLEERTAAFARRLSPSPARLTLPAADRLDPGAVAAFVDDALDAGGQDRSSAWASRARHLLAGLDGVISAMDAAADDALAPLDHLLAQLSSAHQTAEAAARTELDEGVAALRDRLRVHLSDMTPEQRAHEGAAELVAAVEALLGTVVTTWRTTLATALQSAENSELAAVSVDGVSTAAGSLQGVTGELPPLPRRLADRSSGLMVAAVGLTVGVLLLPSGGSSLLVGAGLTAGSFAAARVLRDRQESQLAELHGDALDAWLREVGVRAGDWLSEHLAQWHQDISQQLTALHEHARLHHHLRSPAALSEAVTEARAGLDALV